MAEEASDLAAGTFTPMKVSRGPGRDHGLTWLRKIVGITRSALKFVLEGNGNDENGAHRVLQEPWQGSTEFYNK